MTFNTSPRSDTLGAAWTRFKKTRARELGNWVEAERALVLARREGADHTVTGDRLMAAEAALQSAIIDFATTDGGQADPMPVALELLRLAERELFDDPPDLRSVEGTADRRAAERLSGSGDRRRAPRTRAASA